MKPPPGMIQLVTRIDVTRMFSMNVPADYLRRLIAREGGHLLEEAILNPRVDPQGTLFFRAQQVKDRDEWFGQDIDTVELSLYVSEMPADRQALPSPLRGIEP